MTQGQGSSDEKRIRDENIPSSNFEIHISDLMVLDTRPATLACFGIRPWVSDLPCLPRDFLTIVVPVLGSRAPLEWKALAQ